MFLYAPKFKLQKWAWQDLYYSVLMRAVTSSHVFYQSPDFPEFHYIYGVDWSLYIPLRNIAISFLQPSILWNFILMEKKRLTDSLVTVQFWVFLSI